MTDVDRTDEATTLLNRLDLLDRLCRSPAHVRDLIEETGQSRSTVHRAVNELTDLGLVERVEAGNRATTTGRLARDRLAALLEEYDDVRRAETVLEALPVETAVDHQVVTGASTVLTAGTAPYRLRDRVLDDVIEASAYRALVPTLEESRLVRALYEHVVTRGKPATLVVSESVFRTLRNEFPRQMVAMAEEGGFTVLVGAVPEFSLGIVDRQSTAGTASGPIVHVVVHSESGSVHGLIVSETDRAVAWAQSQFERRRDEATDRTADLVPDTDGGVRALGGRPDMTLGQSLPVSLEREGFVRIDAEYFRNEPVAKPTSAWRAGLSLAEVHTGYAIDRRAKTRNRSAKQSVEDAVTSASSTDTSGSHQLESITDDGSVDGPIVDSIDGSVGDAGDDPLDDQPDLATAITDELVAGENCVVLGPPGSGKSTLCKQVACRWYESDRGPVVYRESDHDRSVDSIDTLVETLANVDGHALLVVEDAPRPDANAVFEAIDRLAGRDDVSVLLDSRSSEWSERFERGSAGTDLDVVLLPPLHRSDCERLVEHFERTIGQSVDVPTDRLWSAIRSDDGSVGEGETHEMLRLIHRLATYADPLSDGATALEEDVATVYETLADDDLALSISVLVNTLNAAGIGVDRGLCYAVGRTGDLDVVDATLERLEGQLLFETGSGKYRTVHEEWSRTYLGHLLDVTSLERAAELFGSTISAVLALADDAARRERINDHLDDHLDERRSLATVTDDPGRWADDVLESIYSMGREQGNLAPLFGDGRSDSVALPTACSAEIADTCPRWLGRAFLAGGYYDRAERAFERLPTDDPAGAVERALGLARVCINRGSFDEAIEHCEDGLAVLEDGWERDPEDSMESASDGPLADDDAPVEIRRARLRKCFGDALSEHNQYEDAEEQYRAALSAVDRSNHPRLTAKIRERLGVMACQQGEYDGAEVEFETSLELARESGDKHLEADVLGSFGTVPWSQGDNDGARECFERALEVQRALGDRHGVAKSLYNLAIVAKRESEYNLARELFERSLEGLREVEDTHTEIRVLGALGLNHLRQGSYDRARSLSEQWLERSQELSDRHDEARALNNIGIVSIHQGRYDESRRSFERSLEIKRELGDTRGQSRTLGNVAFLEILRGRFSRAREFVEESQELLAAFDGDAETASPENYRGWIALRQGEFARACKHFERARTLANDANASLKLTEALNGIAEVSLREGDLERANEALDEAASAIEGVESPLENSIRLLRGQVALATGDLDEAAALARTTLEETESIGEPRWIGRSRQLLGDVAAAEGDEDAARERLLDAIERFEEIGAYPDAVETLASLLELFDEGEVTEDDWPSSVRAVIENAPPECLDDELVSQLDLC